MIRRITAVLLSPVVLIGIGLNGIAPALFSQQPASRRMTTISWLCSFCSA